MRRSALTPVAILVAVLAVLVAVAALAPAPSSDQDPSSTANGRAGTLALYDWLPSAGESVHRIYSEFDLGQTDVLICAAPLGEYAFTASDAAALTRFLDGGGSAIVAVSDPTAVAAVLQPLGIGAFASELSGAAPAQPFPGSSAVTSVPLVAPGASPSGAVWSFSGGGGGLVPLLGDAAEPVAAALRVGAGRLYLLGSEYPLSNDGLRRGDSAAFLLGLLQGARGPRVGFDEVHHLGPAGATDQGLTAVVQGPLLAAALLAVAVLLVHLATSGRRLGSPQPREDPARVPSVVEHITAVGHLLARSRERGAVAARYADELKLRVGRATGVEPRLPDPDFVAALTGFGEERAGAAAAVLDAARRLAAGRPGEDELLGLARRVDALETEWGAAEIR
ncbi:MAG: DUF4350 domain-containing protein [Candidatus Dormibacteria bacterium]